MRVFQRFSALQALSGGHAEGMLGQYGAGPLPQQATMDAIGLYGTKVLPLVRDMVL